MTSPIRILIAEDHAMVRKSLNLLLSTQSDFEVVGEAENGQAAVELTQRLQPDVVVMDYNMPQMNGVEATRKIRQDCPRARVVAFSWYDDKLFSDDMLGAGACAFVAKAERTSAIIAAIRQAAAPAAPAVGSSEGDGLVSPGCA